MLPPTLSPEISRILGKSLRKYANRPMTKKKQTMMPMPMSFRAIRPPSLLNQNLATRLGCNRYKIRLMRSLGSVLKYSARAAARLCLDALRRSVRLRLSCTPLLVVTLLPLRGRFLPLKFAIWLHLFLDNHKDTSIIANPAAGRLY